MTLCKRTPFFMFFMLPQPGQGAYPKKEPPYRNLETMQKRQPRQNLILKEDNTRGMEAGRLELVQKTVDRHRQTTLPSVKN